MITVILKPRLFLNLLNKNFKYLLLVFFLSVAVVFNLFAHWGGHSKESNPVALNTWTLQNGQVVKGNFSFAKGEAIYLEDVNGHLFHLPLNDFSLSDQRFLQFKIKRVEALNIISPSNGIAVNVESVKINYAMLALTLLLFLLTAYIFFQLYVQLKCWFLFRNGKKIRMVSLSLLAAISLFACKKSSGTIVTPPLPVVTIPKTSTGFLDSSFAGFKPAVSTRYDATYYYIASSGFPNHNMMVGITSWQQQVPISQNYTGTNSWSIPLQPVYATTPLSTKSNFMKGAVAVAVNGIPIFNALNNRGEDSYMIGELDNWGGHCGRADDYHYHAAPMHLSGINGLLPIAFALDGFAVYGSKEADGSVMQSLDTCHGHILSKGTYHYHGTTNYPYVVGAMKGKVTTDPATPAPENQILPQAFAAPLRPALTPLNGASIIGFESLVGVNGYKLTYKRGTKNGYVEYSWDASNKYKFTFTDTAGVVVIANYQR